MTQSTLGFIFPGQGSQKIGMLGDIARRHELLLESFDQASEVLGYDLWNLSQYGTEEEITPTEVTQPLLLTASVALWRLWNSLTDIRPAAMAGHSLGEWSALVCAGSVAFGDALILVQKRGQHMQTAVPFGEGAMTAIVGLDDEQIRSACDATAQGEVVAPVNFNAPGQVVIAGHAAAVARASDACTEAGAKRALPLPVSAPFHTSLMQPAADKLAQDIQTTAFSAPVIPVIHNVTLDSEADPELIKQLLIRQITAPVPWVGTVQKLSSIGITMMCECGPGKVLSGLGKRIDQCITGFHTGTLDGLESALANFN